MINKIKKKMSNLFRNVISIFDINKNLNNKINKIYRILLETRTALGLAKKYGIYDLLVHKEISERVKNSNNPLNKNKFNGFSQNQEDGITLEILRRMGIKNGFFTEFGVGNGLENNTIILLAAGWKGAWFGAQNLAFDTTNSTKLSFKKEWITKDNIFNLYSELNKSADVISLDLDGNDIYLIEALLNNNVSPKLFIIEYNAKFPPSIDFKIDYDKDFIIDYGEDYYGASLSSFNSLFVDFGYQLVCCDITGSNAFFIHNSYSDKFTDIPSDINDLYSEPFYFPRNKKMHNTSIKTLEKLIK